MEEKIQIIRETLSIDKESAEKALRLAQGNLKEALQMGDYIDKKYLIIHAKFKYEEHSRNYLLFNLIWNAKSGELIRSDILITNKEKASNIDLEVSNKAFANSLNRIDVEDNNKSIIYKFINDLKEEFNPTIIFNIFKLAMEDKIGKIKIIIEEHIHNINQNPLELILFIDLMTKAQLESLYPDIFTVDHQDKEADEDEEVKEDKKLNMEINLNATPIIAPFNGVKASKLKIGDRLAVKITDPREIGKYLGNLLGDSKGEVIGIIDNIHYNPNLNRYSITLKFGPHILGSIIIEPEVRILTIDEESKKKEIEKDPSSDDKKYKKHLYFGIMILILILVGLVMIY